MTISASNQSIKELREMIEEQAREITRLREALRWEKEKFSALERRVYGVKSERLTAQELEDFLPGIAGVSGDVYQAPEQTRVVVRQTQRVEKSGGIRSHIPEHLEREEVVLVPLDVQAAPENFQRIGEEFTERLDYKPGKIFCRRYIQPKYKSLTKANTFYQHIPPLTVP